MTGTSLSEGEAAAQPGHGAATFQRPLRSRFQARLMPSVRLLKLYCMHCLKNVA
jgi:hypothetical protein